MNIPGTFEAPGSMLQRCLRRPGRSAVFALLALAIAGCGGGGGGNGNGGGDGGSGGDDGNDNGNDNGQPGFSVSYPTPNANLGGRVDKSTVTGTLHETGGDGVVEFDDVNFIDVNGVMATRDMDDPGRWSVRVPVGTPGDTLDVTAGFSDGTSDSTSQSLDNQPLFGELQAAALDTANDRVLVLDGDHDALLAVDLTTGEHTILSDADNGADTTNFSSPGGVALDAANDRAFVVDLSLDALIAVDLTTGDRTVVSDDDNGTGTNLSFPMDVALDADNGRALVPDFVLASLIAVDLTTGNRTLVSGGGNGGGVNFSRPWDVALDAANDRALVADRALDALISVDLGTGDRTIVSDAGNGAGPDFLNPKVVVLDAANERALVVDSDLVSLLAVDLTTGDRTIVAENGTTGAGPDFGFSADDDPLPGVTLDTANDRALVVDEVLDALFAVDLTSGERTIISDADNGAGPGFSDPSDVALDAANGRALVVDENLDALFAVDLTTGDRTIVSDEDPDDDGDTTDRIGSGPGFTSPMGMLLDAANDRALVVDEDLGALVSVDLVTGDRTMVSDEDPDDDGDPSDRIGSGPGFSSPKGVLLDAADDRALVVDEDLEALLSVDLATGDRTIISDEDPDNDGDTSDRIGSGPVFFIPEDVTLDAVNGRALVVDDALDALVAVDLTTGDRTIVSDDDTGSGPRFSNPRGVARDAANHRILVSDDSRLFVVEPDSGERALVSSSY